MDTLHDYTALQAAALRGSPRKFVQSGSAANRTAPRAQRRLNCVNRGPLDHCRVGRERPLLRITHYVTRKSAGRSSQRGCILVDLDSSISSTDAGIKMSIFPLACYRT